MQTYKGSCHCGAVTYEVETEITEGYKCNCSHCARKGFIPTFVPATQFKLLTGEDNLTTYQFNKKRIDHRFCKTCGVQPFGNSTSPDGTPMVAINLNTLEDFDLDSITIKPVDGKSY